MLRHDSWIPFQKEIGHDDERLLVGASDGVRMLHSPLTEGSSCRIRQQSHRWMLESRALIWIARVMTRILEAVP